MSSRITPAKAQGHPAAGPRGRHALVERLTAQVGGEDRAMAILRARGHVDEEGRLTAAGRARDAMSAEERAIDRAKKRSKTPFGQMGKNYAYDPQTNRATLKGKK